MSPEASSHPALEVGDLHFSYTAPRAARTKTETRVEVSEVLRGLSFKASFGRLTGLLGPNGSGKSTSFKILSTQLVPSRGMARVNGIDVVNDPARARQSLGVTFQSPSLDPILSVSENLRVHAALMGLSKSEGGARIERRLRDLGVWDRRDSRVKDLSGGLARRAELAKTLLADPKVLLLDEPTSGLDPSSRRDFWKILKDLMSRETAILVTTHLMEEAEFCDDLIFISEGQVAAQGSPETLKREFGSEVLLLDGPGIELQRDRVVAMLGAGVSVSQQGSSLRLEGAAIADSLGRLKSELGSDLSGLQWSRGTLADIYLRKTGKELVAT